MPNVTMISGDWWKMVTKKAKPKYAVSSSAQTIEVVIDFDENMYKLLQRDPLLLQKLSDSGSEVYKAFITTCIGHVSWGEALIEKANRGYSASKDIKKFNIAVSNAQQGMAKLLKAEVDKAQADIPNAIRKAWSEYQGARTEYRNYKFRAGCKLGLKAASLLLNASRLVATAGIDALAWRGAVKNATKGYNELVSLTLSADELQKKIEKNLKAVTNWHTKLGNGKRATGSDVGLGLLKVLVGTDCGKTLDSLSSATKNYKKKLIGVDLKSHEVAKQLNGVLAKLEAAQAELPQESGKVMKSLGEKFYELFTSVSDTQGSVKLGKAWATDMEARIDEMKKARNVKQLGRVLKLIETLETGLKRGLLPKKAAKCGTALATAITKDAVNAGKLIDRWFDDAKKLKKKLAR
ncbi:MAG: hypothetical protein AAF394_15250 [Planctomycetota bacterium]